MNYVVLTIFPEMVDPYFESGMIRKAREDNLISCSSINVRDFAEGRHRVTDDKPYGGGCGMVMKPEPLAGAIRHVKSSHPGTRTIYLSPQGRTFNQDIAQELAGYDSLAFVCGRYEGIDDRVCHELIDEELSIGDYVMTGGELGAMVIIDAVARLVPGVLGGDESAEKDSFQDGLLEHAHFTRPPEFENEAVPDVLLSGNHAAIDRWRLENSLKRTFLKRVDLLENRSFNREEKDILKKWCQDLEKLTKT